MPYCLMTGQQQRHGKYGPDIFNQNLSLQSILSHLLASTDWLKELCFL